MGADEKPNYDGLFTVAESRGLDSRLLTGELDGRAFPNAYVYLLAFLGVGIPLLAIAGAGLAIRNLRQRRGRAVVALVVALVAGAIGTWCWWVVLATAEVKA